MQSTAYLKDHGKCSNVYSHAQGFGKVGRTTLRLFFQSKATQNRWRLVQMVYSKTASSQQRQWLRSFVASLSVRVVALTPAV